MIEGREKILTAFTAPLQSEALNRFIDRVDEVVTEELLKSFTKEGHKLTGKLIEDMKGEVSTEIGMFAIDFLAYKYGAYLNFGVKANRIPYSRGSGAGTSQYIEGLMKYVRLRMGISGPQQKSVAFAIATVQKKKGMPIRTSGAGTGWIDNTTGQVERQITPFFAELAETFVVKGIKDTVRDGNNSQ